MSRKIIDIGQKGNDGTGDSLRDSFRKINDNFQELYSVTGLGDQLAFTGLVDTPNTYVGNDNSVVSVNNNGTSLTFKQLVGGAGVTFDYETNPNEIIVNAAFSNIQSDESPQLGGPVNAYSGGERYPIGGLPDLNNQSEVDDVISKLTTNFSSDQQAYNPLRLAVNKGYADSKISLAGTESINTATGVTDPSQGIMTGPLILARDPVAEDDTGPFAGRIAATKRYVDNSSYYSRVNLYVSTSGIDAREDVAKEQQGRALAYSYKTIEAAAKRAEEIILEAPIELGPYKKRLTYTVDEVTYPCTLTSIVTSPLSGIGCVASARMTVDTIELNDPGQGYLPQDVLSLIGGTGSQVTIRVITSQPGTGEILTFEILTTGNYSVLPGSSDVETVTNSEFGSGATVDLTYKVNSIVVDTAGSGYDLVSVRISGGGGVGAFATADVIDGEVASISMTAQGSGYTSIPTVTVELPRFKIFTNGLKTDFTVAPGPSRDIREGNHLRGVTSGALANILSHSGALDGLDELFEVEIVSGAFELGEELDYGDVVKKTNITIIVESGTYEENFPIKVSANVSITGDEFRRTIIRPRPGMSTSPWAGTHFCRDVVLDGLTLVTQRFGRHYLTDSTQPIYPLINNPGRYTSAARIIELNRNFIKLEVIGWIEAQIANNLGAFAGGFDYDRALCARDAGLLIDSMVFDLKYGGQNRTVSAALKYYMGVTDFGNSLIAITTQKFQTIAAINYLNTVAQAVLDGVPPAAVFQTVEEQTIDPGIIPEVGSETIFASMISIVTAIINDENNFNAPKNNDELDVYLMNDATRLHQQTIQGNGGFALVLDPEGQILTKSPYAQVGTVFAKSINKQTFTGSLFIDGFSGNQQFTLESKTDNFNLNVGELVRKPQAPFTFFRNGEAYRVNFIRNYEFDPAGSTATFVMDESTPYPLDLFTYNESKCFRDTGLIIDAVLTDLVFGTNYQSTKAGQAYQRAYSSEVIDSQLFETVQAINYARDRGLDLVTDPAARSIITGRFLVVTNILSRGTTATPVLLYPNNVNAADGIYNASVLLQKNKSFIRAEIVAWINNEIADGPGSSGNTIWNGFTYNSTTCSRDVGYLLEAFTFDLLYGGNLSIVDNARSYWYNSVSVFAGQTAQSAAAYTRLKAVIQNVVQSITVTPTTGNTETQIEDLVNNGSSTAATTLGTLADIIIAAVSSEASIPVSATNPVYTNSINTLYISVRTTVQASKATIQQATIDNINDVISKFELITPGNRSMISNDFTSINDMGYGLLATNGGLTEAVSMFTYYCYTAYYALNGGQIRSIGGSSANGVYALKAEGSDPLEIPDIVFLHDNVSQGATVYAPGGLAPYQSVIRGLTLYAEYDDYVPYNQSEIEIDHAGVIVRYLISSADIGGSVPAGVVKLNIATTGAANTSTAGLVAPVADGTRITIRSVFTFKLDDVTAIAQTRPSTALVFIENTEKVYRVLSLNSAGLPSGQARMTLRENYDFIDALIFNTGDPLNPQPADHGDVGDVQVAVNNLATQDAIRAVGSQFCWIGTLHTITAYENTDQTGEAYARIKFSPALADTLIGYEDQVSIRAGAQAGMSGDITVAISTARFTGHDLLDIGTGSYADTNYPDVIYGLPANPKDPQKEVQEIGKGRVFFVSTDQDGNFRVGDLFRVDQGTGTVTFAAAIALSSLDGLGFKRGVQIAEFSTDDTFADNATDTVPVEQAVRAYIDRRLGINHNGGIVDDPNLIPDINGGYMALNGDLPMKADMDMGSNKVTNMEDPINPLDAVNKRWHTLGNLQDAALTSPTDASFLTFTGAGTSTVNAAITGDVTVTRSGNTLTSAITAGSIVNADISASAAIAQSKISLSDATAAATSGAATKGIASFDSANFETTSGWVGIKANGVALTEIAQIAGRSVVANNSIGTANVTAVLMTDVINNGGAVKKSQFSAVGYLRRNNLGDFGQDTSYEIINDATGNTANTLVRRDSNGDFAARIANFQSLSIDSKTVIDTELLNEPNNAGTIKLYSYNGVEAITLGDGAQETDKKNFYRNQEHYFQTQNGLGLGTVRMGTLTTGASNTAGSIVGQWAVGAGSQLDAALGTLKSTTLTTGAVGTAGTITGTWSLGSNSTLTVGTGSIDARTGTLYTDTLNAGTAGTAGLVTGTWTVDSGSSFIATSVVNQANSATIAAATANTVNTIVLRNASGDFSARNITATSFLGNATTATSAGQWTTTRTISLTGDVTGSANIDGTGNISITTTVGGNTVVLGTDTQGQYAKSIAVSGTGISITAAGVDDGTDYTITSSATNLNTASAIVQRDGSGNFTAGTITAALTGNASSATVASTVSVTATNNNQSYYVLFVDDSATGSRAARTESEIVYNPGTNVLTIGSGNGTVSANLSGNATTATTATTLNSSGNYRLNSLGVGTDASNTTGEIRATNNITAYFSSDAKFKENIKDVDGALDKVCAIGSKTFDWTDEYVDSKGGEDGYFVRKSDFGVVAQDVQQVFPQAVRTREDGSLAVDYEKLATLAFGAIIELRAEIDSIKKKLG